MIRNYKITVKLKGFEKEIKRTFLVNDNVKIDTFCYVVIKSMNGDLFHLYELKYKDKVYLSEYCEKNAYNEVKMGSMRLSKLLLDEKDKMELVYDFGDWWVFKITVNKVYDGHNEKNIELLNGLGCGIEEDCGGTWSLEDLINNPDNEWGYDYNNFKLEEQNKWLDKYFNVRK